MIKAHKRKQPAPNSHVDKTVEGDAVVDPAERIAAMTVVGQTAAAATRSKTSFFQPAAEESMAPAETTPLAAVGDNTHTAEPRTTEYTPAETPAASAVPTTALQSSSPTCTNCTMTNGLQRRRAQRTRIPGPPIKRVARAVGQEACDDLDLDSIRSSWNKSLPERCLRQI